MISWIQRTFQQHFPAIFGVLLALLIISFVVTYAPSSGIGRADNTIATRPFFGLNLASPKDEQQLMGDAALSISLQAGYMGLQNDQLQQYAFQRYAAIHLADRLHVPAPTPDELTGLLKTMRAFAGPDGEFDAARYATFRDSLRNDPAHAADVSRVLSDDWRVSRIEQLLGGPGYVLPADVKNQLIQADSVWTVALATAELANFTVKIEPTDAELAKFFDQNSFRYEIPPRVSASYVEFPAAEFAREVTVTDAEVKAYYDANPGRFPKPVDPKAPAPAPAVAPKADPAADFAAVRPQVEAALKAERTQRLAIKAASDLAYALFEGKVTEGPSLTAFLAARKVAAKPLAPFTQEEGPKELGGSPDIAEAAFKLNADRYYSDALPAPGGAVVLFWKDTLPARKPQLSEVRAKVAADYVETEKRRRFAEQGKTIRTQIEARLKAGDAFAQAAAAAGASVKLQTKTPAPFTLRQPPQDIDASVLGELPAMQKGQLSDFIAEADQGVLVYVADKKLPDLDETGATYLAARAQLEGSIARYNTDSYLGDLVAQELKKSEPVTQ